MALQKILQRNQSAVAIPKCHVSHSRNKRPLATGNQFSQTTRRSYRSAAAPIDLIVFAAQYQRRYLDLRRSCECIPRKACLLVQPKLLDRALPGAEGGREFGRQVTGLRS